MLMWVSAVHTMLQSGAELAVSCLPLHCCCGHLHSRIQCRIADALTPLLRVQRTRLQQSHAVLRCQLLATSESKQAAVQLRPGRRCISWHGHENCQPAFGEANVGRSCTQRGCKADSKNSAVGLRPELSVVQAGQGAARCAPKSQAYVHPKHALSWLRALC